MAPDRTRSTAADRRPRRAVTTALGALVVAATAAVMWPVHQVVVVVVEETNSEYGKAAGAYGTPVPPTVEGGSPAFIVVAVVVLAAAEVAGIAVLASVLAGRGITGRRRTVAVLVVALVLASGYVMTHLLTGPRWPPSLG